MTTEEREALEWLQGLPVTNPGTKVVDHVATILLMLAARDPGGGDDRTQPQSAGGISPG